MLSDLSALRCETRAMTTAKHASIAGPPGRRLLNKVPVVTTFFWVYLTVTKKDETRPSVAREGATSAR